MEIVILGVTLVLAGSYITYLHHKLKRFDFYMALFAATWEATWDTVGEIQSLSDTLDLIQEDVAKGKDCCTPSTYSLVEYYRSELDKHIDFLSGVLNCEVELDIEIEVED